MFRTARNIAVLTMLPLVTMTTARAQTDLQLSVDITAELAERGLDEIQRGAVRVRLESDGPRLFLDTLLLPATAERSAALFADAGCLSLSRFDSASRTRLGGSFFAFDYKPSTALAELSQSADGEGLLQFDYVREAAGFAGFAIRLHDPQPLEGVLYYLDARGFRTLSFAVRGQLGGERVMVRMSEAESNRSDAAHNLGAISDLIESGALTSTWQRAVIDLEQLPSGLDRASLDKLVLLPAQPGSGRIEINDVQLCRPGYTPNDSLALTGPDLPEQRGLWVWRTSDLLTDSTAVTEFLTFLEAQQIDTVYLQLPSGFLGPGAEFEPTRDAGHLRELMRQLHGIGVTVTGAGRRAGVRASRAPRSRHRDDTQRRPLQRICRPVQPFRRCALRHRAVLARRVFRRGSVAHFSRLSAAAGGGAYTRDVGAPALRGRHPLLVRHDRDPTGTGERFSRAHAAE